MNRIAIGAIATCRFELQRSFTFQRTAVSVILAMFPPTMLFLLSLGSKVAASSSGLQDFSKLLTVFLIALVCLLSQLLWATPNVNSELEGKSWGFISSRPGGRVSIFLGKFLASFCVSLTISLVALSLCVLVADRMLGVSQLESFWIAMFGVYGFGCFVYSAVFSMIGTLFIKRGMVVAAGYLVGSEIVLASVPGVLINKLTIRFHLQELGIRWAGWFLPSPSKLEDYRKVFGNGLPTWAHMGILLLIAAAALAIGIWIIVSREYITTEES
ncbi:MAG: hypothetical protein AB8B55_00870 [Mariniblastus sp.]